MGQSGRWEGPRSDGTVARLPGRRSCLGVIGPMIKTSARLILLAGLFLRSGIAHAEDGATGRPPNVLLLLSDDQRPDTIHVLGNRVIRTPHLDRLVEAGTTFTRALSPSPVCVTSRA